MSFVIVHTDGLTFWNENIITSIARHSHGSTSTIQVWIANLSIRVSGSGVRSYHVIPRCNSRVNGSDANPAVSDMY